MNANAGDTGGWKHYEIPRSEFYEALDEVLQDFSEFLIDDPEAARKLEQDPYNDYFYAGFGGDEDSFRISLWPSDLATYELYENGEISEQEFRANTWPRSGGRPVTVYLGDADTVIEIAEDEGAVRQLADQLAAFAGIVLVDDWDEGDGGDAAEDGEA